MTKTGDVTEVLRLRLDCGRLAEIWKGVDGKLQYEIGGTPLTDLDLRNLAEAAKRMAVRE